MSMILLEKVAIISIEMRCTSGSRRLRAEDLQLGAGGRLPPEKVASLGSKKVINPDDLKPFMRLRKEVDRICSARGCRFLSGYANPIEVIDTVDKELHRLKAEFEAEKRKFLDNYDIRVNEWIAEHPEFEDALRRAILSRAQVDETIGFRHAIYRITPEAQSGSLSTVVSEMGDTLLTEVAQEASEFYRDSLQRPAEALTRRAFSPLRRIRVKLDAMSFVDGAIIPMVKAIDELLARVPTDKSEKIPLTLFNELIGMTLVLADLSKVRDHAIGLLNISNVVALNVRSAAPTDSGELFTDDKEPVTAPPSTGTEASVDEDPIVPPASVDNDSCYF